METQTQANLPQGSWLRLEHYFHRSVMLMLVFTALCKLFSVSSEAKVLLVADPIFSFLNLRQLLLLTAVTELGVLAYLYKSANPLGKTFMVFWLSAIFITYRLGLWLKNYKGCACLGTVTQWMAIPPATVDLITKLMLAYMSAGALIFLAQQLLKKRDLRTPCHPLTMA